MEKISTSAASLPPKYPPPASMTSESHFYRIQLQAELFSPDFGVRALCPSTPVWFQGFWLPFSS
jgi:hypothetical protein